MKCSVLQMRRLSWALCVLLLLLLLLLLQGAVQGCFIRNCPPGGKKRSVDSVPSTKQCMSCHKGAGQCVGSDICCGWTIGCLMGTPEAKKCEKEDEDPIPCLVSGHRCGTKNTGNCVADGICCEDDACRFTSMCRMPGLGVHATNTAHVRPPALGQQAGALLTNYLPSAWLTNHRD